MILNNKKAESLAPHRIMKRVATIWRALWWPENASVMMASTTKFVPPAKSGIGGYSASANVLETMDHTGKLVEFQSESYRKEEKLVSDGNQQRYR